MSQDTIFHHSLSHPGRVAGSGVGKMYALNGQEGELCSPVSTSPSIGSQNTDVLLYLGFSGRATEVVWVCCAVL